MSDSVFPVTESKCVFIVMGGDKAAEDAAASLICLVAAESRGLWCCRHLAHCCADTSGALSAVVASALEILFSSDSLTADTIFTRPTKNCC